MKNTISFKESHSKVKINSKEAHSLAYLQMVPETYGGPLMA